MNKEDIKPINKRIATYRKISGYTQQAAADALGMKKATYARMELRGNPPSDMLLKLAKLYQVEPMVLMFGVDPNKVASKDDEPTRLNDNNNVFLKRQVTDITLTVNERNCIKACRKLSKEQRTEIMNLINKYYREANKK